MTAKNYAEDLQRLHRELRELVNCSTVARAESLAAPIGIFNGNLRDLLQVFEVQVSTGTDFRLLGLEIARLIHNFVASAQTLIDHTRRLYNSCYKETGTFPTYQDRVDSSFANDPISRFVKGMRNFFEHYEVPPIQFSSEHSIGHRSSTRILLPVSGLKKFKGWHVLAAKYIETEGAAVDLRFVIDKYAATVREFYNWFYEQLSEIHAADLARIEAKQAEIRELQEGMAWVAVSKKDQR